MRVIVVGAGAMGSIFRAALRRARCDVAFCDIRPDVVAAFHQPGFALTGVLGDSVTPYPASLDAADLGQADVALVQVDSSATSEAARIAQACLRPSGFA